MIKNLPANAGEMSSIPDLGRSHMSMGKRKNGTDGPIFMAGTETQV